MSSGAEAEAQLAAAIRHRLGPAPEREEWPLVSIVVLNRDGAAHLRRLLDGLIAHTDYPALELILVDNASTDDSLDFSRRLEAPFPIAILANAHNESFAVGCNQGAGIATGELLLFLNNDAVPFEPGWLRELVACLLDSDAVAAAGPTLIEPPGGAADSYLVHQRGLRSREAEGGRFVPVYRDRGAEPLGAWLGEDEDVLAVAAACLLIGRGEFDAAGGYTPGYWYGPEDVDLALKLRERGGAVRCSGRSLLIHPPGSSLDALDGARRSEWVRGNRRLFTELWGARVRRECELDRLRGGGLWVEPCPPGSSWGDTEEELARLGFCLVSAAPEGAAEADPALEEVAAELRRRGSRALVLRGAAVDDLAACEYDVVVHRGDVGRYAPRPAQLNVLWSPVGGLTHRPFEAAPYDLLLDGREGLTGGSVGAWAERLIGVAEELARGRAYRRRISREPPFDVSLSLGERVER